MSLNKAFGIGISCEFGWNNTWDHMGNGSTSREKVSSWEFIRLYVQAYPFPVMLHFSECISYNKRVQIKYSQIHHIPRLLWFHTMQYQKTLKQLTGSFTAPTCGTVATRTLPYLLGTDAIKFSDENRTLWNNEHRKKLEAEGNTRRKQGP